MHLKVYLSRMEQCYKRVVYEKVIYKLITKFVALKVKMLIFLNFSYQIIFLNILNNLMENFMPFVNFVAGTQATWASVIMSMSKIYQKWFF